MSCKGNFILYSQWIRLPVTNRELSLSKGVFVSMHESIIYNIMYYYIMRTCCGLRLHEIYHCYITYMIWIINYFIIYMLYITSTLFTCLTSVLSNPRPAGPADWFHAARQCWLKLLEIILCVKNQVKNKTWLDIWQHQHKSNSLIF